MNKSESIMNLAAALSQAQSEIKNTPASGSNPHFNSRYTPLDDVLDMARSVLPKHGLSVLQSVSGASDTISVVTMILHSSGEWLESDLLTMKADKVTPQGQGSAITYGRRYSLSAMLGIATDPDDDGNAANGKTDTKAPEKPPTVKAPAVTVARVTTKDLDPIYKTIMDKDGNINLVEAERFKGVYTSHGFKTAKDITLDKFEAIKAEFINYALPEVLK